MKIENRVFIAGAGPVGLVAAACLVNDGVPVTVFEASPSLSTESRASTFHPPTLDFLADLGFADDLVRIGLKAPRFQYRTKDEGIVARFDFQDISGHTGYPFRLQCEQFKLTELILAKLVGCPNFEIVFDSKVEDVAQDDESVTVSVSRQGGGALQERHGRWLIGADGARSAVRQAIGSDFEGFTWPEQFLVIGSPFDFQGVLPDLDSVSYVADPVRWHFLLQIPDMWRVMFPVPQATSDATATSPDYAQEALRFAVPRHSPYEIVHSTLYRVHQRVAKKYRVGRVFLAGDAAHVNNPLGGMGMNGGIHDAIALGDLLGKAWADPRSEKSLDLYEEDRRTATVSYIQTQTIQNKRNLESASEQERRSFRESMSRAAGDAELARDYLLKVSMIDSIRSSPLLGRIHSDGTARRKKISAAGKSGAQTISSS